MTRDRVGLRERSLNTIAGVALSKQLDGVEPLEVQVKPDPDKLTWRELKSSIAEIQIGSIAVHSWNAREGVVQFA